MFLVEMDYDDDDVSEGAGIAVVLVLVLCLPSSTWAGGGLHGMWHGKQ